MLKVAKDFEPDIVAVLGDFADAACLSAHAPTKAGGLDFEEELDAVRLALRQLDDLGATRKIYIEGNHEFRLSRYLADKAPALFRSMAWPSLLDLKAKGWEWVPYRTSARIGKLHLTHDTGSAGINAHRTSAQKFMGSTVIGHTHRMAYEVRGKFEGSAYLAAMLGWLGDATAGDYLHEVDVAGWVHGFGVGYMETSGIVHLQPVPIVNGACVVNGVLYR